MAKRHLIITEHWIEREPEVAKSYQQCVAKYIEKMHVRKVDVIEQDSGSGGSYLIFQYLEWTKQQQSTNCIWCIGNA